MKKFYVLFAVVAFVSASSVLAQDMPMTAAVEECYDDAGAVAPCPVAEVPVEEAAPLETTAFIEPVVDEVIQSQSVESVEENPEIDASIEETTDVLTEVAE